jgi:hypothetical protein
MRKPSLHKLLIVVSALVILVPVLVTLLKIIVTREALFLCSEGGARWIKMTERVNLKTWTDRSAVAYSGQFLLEKAVSDSVLTVRALGKTQVYLDGQSIAPFSERDDRKNPRSIALRDLSPGRHELIIAVSNEKGPALVLAYSDALGIFTGPGWKASMDGQHWLPVTLADDKKPADASLRFPSAFEAFREVVPVYLPLFAVCFFLVLFFQSAPEKYPWISRTAWNPSSVRLTLLAAWAVLAVNNIMKIPLYVGYDVVHHYAYISYITEKGTLPLATEGWQMFQSPLFYLLSAGLWKFLSLFLPANAAQFLLRIIPLCCGALQVQLAYQAVRYVFPSRTDLQTLGTIVGGFLPMNFYISQVVGNEPLAGFLSAAAIVIALGILTKTGPLPKGRLAFLGIMLGLACLTKFTAVLLIPAFVLLLIYVMSEKEQPPKSIVAGIAIFLGAVVLVSGWYYLRNWIALGKPFVGGWDIARGQVWWQDPGYRTVGDFISFGRSLSHPIFSAIYGFWDAIYSTFWLDGLNSSIVSYEIKPPWNYDFMLSGALFSLLPAGGIIFGIIRGVGKPKAAHPGQVFSAYCIAVYFTALLYLYVALPIYSTAKATYTVGLIPCYAIMCVSGLDVFTRNKYLRAAVYALLICWAVSAYASYFVA